MKVLLTNKQQESYRNAKICSICKEQFEDEYINDKNIANLEIIVIIQLNVDVLHSPA